MGFAFMMGPCRFCNQVFSFNPVKVPSVRRTPDGLKEPVCLACYGRVQEARKAHGLEPWPEVDLDAYEACPEEELP